MEYCGFTEPLEEKIESLSKFAVILKKNFYDMLMTIRRSYMENQKKIGRESLLLSGFLLLFYAICFLVPGLSMIASLLMTAIICILGVRFTILTAGISSVVLFLVSVLAAFFVKGGVEFVLSPIVFMAAFGGITTAVCIRKKCSIARTTICSTVAVLAGILLPIFLLNQFFVPTYIATMKKEVLSYLYEAIQTLTVSLKLDSSMVEQFKAQYVTILKLISPSLGIIGMALYAFLYPFIAKAYCRKKKDTSWDYLPLFTALRSDKITPIVFILSFVLSMILSNQMMMVFLNLGFITGAIMMVFGISLISFYIQHFIRRVWTRIIVYVLLLFIPSVAFFFILLGIIDAFANWRHLPSRGDKLE